MKCWLTSTRPPGRRYAYGSSERGRGANRCSGDDERATWAGGTSYDTRTRHAGHAKVLLSNRNADMYMTQHDRRPAPPAPPHRWSQFRGWEIRGRAAWASGA